MLITLDRHLSYIYAHFLLFYKRIYRSNINFSKQNLIIVLKGCSAIVDLYNSPYVILLKSYVFVFYSTIVCADLQNKKKLIAKSYLSSKVTGGSPSFSSNTCCTLTFPHDRANYVYLVVGVCRIDEWTFSYLESPCGTQLSPHCLVNVAEFFLTLTFLLQNVSYVLGNLKVFETSYNIAITPPLAVSLSSHSPCPIFSIWNVLSYID